MKKQTLGMNIATLRKEKGMTQLELADKMGVTDKAVSKWERDLACPDVATLPKLAEIFGISVDELMHSNKQKRFNKLEELMPLVFNALALAMGIGVTVLAVLKELDVQSGFVMLGIGLTCLAITKLNQ